MEARKPRSWFSARRRTRVPPRRPIRPSSSAPAPVHATSSTSLGSGSESDDLESPYAVKPASSAGIASKPASLESSSGKVSASKAPECSQPFTVDDNGIRRVRPECL